VVHCVVRLQGKTALCDELGRLVVRRRGLFARAKFDAGQDPPWAPMLQAIRTLMLHLVALDSILWKVRLLRALDVPTCSLLVESMPEIELLLGTLPAAPKLSPHERQTQTRLAIVQLVAALSTPDSPLCLCVDDLHLANADALQLLQQIFAHACSQSCFLLLVCAFRPVSAAHPLIEFVRQVKAISRSSNSPGSPSCGNGHCVMRSRGGSGGRPNQSSPLTRGNRVIEMELAVLNQQHVAQLLSDSFPRSNHSFESIAAVLHPKTQGLSAMQMRRQAGGGCGKHRRRHDLFCVRSHVF